MADGLERALSLSVERCRRWRRTQDPTPVLDALGWLVALDLVRGASGVDPAVVAQLGRQGPLAVARVEAGTDEDDALAARVGRAGLGVLGDPAGQPPGDAPADLTPPSPRRILRMLRGELDGLSAASCAARLARDGVDAAAVLAMATSAGAPPTTIAVAAADPEPIRAPAEGRVVARLPAPGLEAVLFHSPPPRRLAIYAERSVPVRLTAAGAATEGMQPGYWIGRLDRRVRGALSATIRVGDREVAWTIPLPPRQ